jgi:O-acetylserine/cysteine efflux transporter
MPIYHLLLALLVVFVWGGNFIFVKLGLNEMPPLLLCSMRFLLASIPAILFIKPPAAPFRMVVLYGIIMFGMQFALLFLGMYAGMPPGLASILVQVQVFFSILFAAFALKEIPTFWQIIGGLISFCGIGLVALHLDHHATLAGFLLIISGAASWGIGNLITKRLAHVNMMSLIVWGSFVAFFPLMLLSLLFEGPSLIIHTFTHISWVGILSVAYIVYFSTWIGYGVWNYLICRYHVSVVVPFTLLVPIVAILSSVIFLHEPFQKWKLAAGLLVITGLCINFLAPRFLNRTILPIAVQPND